MRSFTCLLVEASGKVFEVMTVTASSPHVAGRQTLILAHGRPGIATIEIWADGLRCLRSDVTNVTHEYSVSHVPFVNPQPDSVRYEPSRLWRQ